VFAHSHQSITTPTRRSSSQPRTSKPKPPAADIHHVPTVSFRAGPPQHVLPSRIPAPCTPRPRSGQPQIKQDRSTVRDQTSLARWQHLRIVAISIIRPQTRSALYRLSIKGIGRYRRGVPGAHRNAHWSGSGAHISSITGSITGNAKARPRQIIRNRIPLHRSRSRGSCLTAARAELAIGQLHSTLQREPAACSSHDPLLVGLVPPAFFSWNTSPTVPLHPLFFETLTFFYLPSGVHSLFPCIASCLSLTQRRYAFFFFLSFLSIFLSYP
jgi:hypothetical protein